MASVTLAIQRSNSRGFCDVTKRLMADIATLDFFSF